MASPIIEVCLHGGVCRSSPIFGFGQVASARLALALLLGVLHACGRRRGWLQLAAAIGLIALLALTGHAGATPGLAGRIHLLSDMVHLLAAGAWLGGLPALAMLLAQARRSGEPAWRAFASRCDCRFSTARDRLRRCPAGHRLGQQLEPVGRPARPGSDRLRPAGPAQDRPVRRHGRHCGGQPIPPHPAAARARRDARASSATAWPRPDSGYACWCSCGARHHGADRPCPRPADRYPARCDLCSYPYQRGHGRRHHRPRHGRGRSASAFA